MSPLRQFAIRNELLYSGFVLPNVQIFFVQIISFATFGVSIDDFFTRYAGLGYSLIVFAFLCLRRHLTVTGIFLVFIQECFNIDKSHMTWLLRKLVFQTD